MDHISLIQLFRTIAKQHKQIKHSIGGRHSFFRMNNEDELINTKNVNVSYPVLLLQQTSGRLADTGDVSNERYVVYEIRNKVNPGDFDSIDIVQSQALTIGENIIARIMELNEEEGDCGPISDFDVNSVQWEYTGPVNDGEYGCRFAFRFRNTAFNQFTQDLGEIFQDDFFVPLLDFDGQPLVDFDGETLKDLE